ncbi:MAG: GAF domain-containing protein [Rhodanobacter sp.]
MVEWIEYAKMAGAFVGALGIATMAKLYHDKVVAGKDNGLAIKTAELVRLQADLVKAEARAQDAEHAAVPAHGDLSRLRGQLGEMLERLALTMQVQAASLYIPLFNAGDERGTAPRSFAFVAAWNIEPAATAAILKMKLVESWTVVGECWDKGTPIVSNNLQSSVRHVPSYDRQSGFAPVSTLVSPVRWQGRPVGVAQFFNKTVQDHAYEVDEQGFGGEDRRLLADALQETSDSGLAGKLHYFQSSPDALRFLGLQGELDLENAVIMYVDLTQSSALYSEMPLVEVARLINRFSRHIYKRVSLFAGVVEKFNGDGAMIRFHYDDADLGQPLGSPALRAMCVAADLIADFRSFKSSHWPGVAQDLAASIRLRVTIALGPVIATTMGPQQFQLPTVIGQCVNRSAKMIGYAPRDRDIVLVDDNVRHALKQIDDGYLATLTDFNQWVDPSVRQAASLAGHLYYEVALEPFRCASAAARRKSGPSQSALSEL